MSNLRVVAVVLMTLVSMFRAEALAQSAYAFDAHTFTFKLPAGYRLADEAVPMPGYKTFGWVTPPHEDGTSAVIQVSLYEVAKMGGQPVPLDQFAGIMVETLRKTYSDWNGQMGALQLMGLDARRVEWAGMLQGPNGALPIRGVMIVGFKDGLYFRLDAQGGAARAAQTLAAAEDALKTFSLTAGK